MIEEIIDNEEDEGRSKKSWTLEPLEEKVGTNYVKWRWGWKTGMGKVPIQYNINSLFSGTSDVAANSYLGTYTNCNSTKQKLILSLAHSQTERKIYCPKILLFIFKHEKRHFLRSSLPPPQSSSMFVIFFTDGKLEIAADEGGVSNYKTNLLAILLWVT